MEQETKTTEQVFLTQEEIQRIQESQVEESNLISILGQVEYQLQVVTNRKANVLAQLQDLQERNLKAGQELQEKYGEGSINMETGEFVKNS